MDKFFNKDYVYAIIGASSDESKYGHKIFKTLIDNDFNAIPINLKGGEILGRKVFTSILGCSEKIDVVLFVISPTVSLEVLKEMVEKNILKAWFQPGSFDNNCLLYCTANGIKFVKDLCLMEKVLSFR